MLLVVNTEGRVILESGVRAATLRRFRLNMSALGFPVDHLSDEQIESGVVRICNAMPDAGITLEQARAALTGFAAAGMNYFNR